MADHGQYPQTSEVDLAQKYIKESYPRNAQPLFLFKDFSARGVLQKNAAPLSYMDLPNIIYDLSKSTGGRDVVSLMDKFERRTRLFYTFANLNGDYYPPIIEAQVTGDSHKPQNWTLTGNTYTAIKNIKPLSNNSCIRFKKFKEYGGYVNGILGSGTKTRGRVYFALPLDKTLYGADIAITLEMAARADEIVDYRDYEILIGNGVISKGRLVAPNYTAISFIITAPLIEANVAKFTLKPLNYSHGHDKETGGEMWTEAFKIKKLTVQKTDLTSTDER